MIASLKHSRLKRSLRRCTKGMALIEFGLALPVLSVFTLVGLELTNYVITHHRVRQIAAMTADNSSRLRSQMSEAYVTQLFTGVKKAGESIRFEQRGRVILSSVQNNAAGNGQWIRWQRCFGQLAQASAYGIQDKGKADTTLPAISGLTAQAGSAIMYAEVSFDYVPLIPSSIWAGKRLSHQIAFIVRQRTDFSIAGASANAC